MNEIEQPPTAVSPVSGSGAALKFWLLCAGSALPLLALTFVPPHRWLVWFPLHLFFQSLLLYGNLRPNCASFGPVITSFETTQQEVWLTIDDGPHPLHTPGILKLLERFGARATFFVIGDRVRAHPELARAILEKGHGLANHSATHPAAWFWALLRNGAWREIDGGAAAIASATGQRPASFRAPVGMVNYFVHAALRERRLPLIGWSARGFDGVSRDPALVTARILRQVRPGGIILLHEGQRDSGDAPLCLVNLETILTRLAEQGYQFVIPEKERWRTAGQPFRP